MARSRPRVLCVDDDENLLAGLRLTLKRKFDVTLAPGGEQGLAAMEEGRPFEVILSDMRMPGMDGATFLAHCRERAPDSTRMLLTGYADLESSIRAVNEGHIFRFLTKPCPPPELVTAMVAGVRQYRLVTAEHVLLEQTLRGTIQTLTEVLALANPEAYGRAGRIKRWARLVAQEVKELQDWSVQVAAMLSQIGAVSLPPETASRFWTGQPLDEAERAMVAALPQTTHKLLAHIPRMEPVLEILDASWLRFDGNGARATAPKGEAIPVGSRLLRILMDVDKLLERGHSGSDISKHLLAGRGSRYDPALVEKVLEALSIELGPGQVIQVDAWGLVPGMVLAEPAQTAGGNLLVPAGQEITQSMVTRLQNVDSRTGLCPLLVFVQRKPA